MKTYAIIAAFVVLVCWAGAATVEAYKAKAEVANAQAREQEVNGTVAQAREGTAVALAQRDALRAAYQNQAKKVTELEQLVEQVTCHGHWREEHRPDGTVIGSCDGDTSEDKEQVMNQDLGQAPVLPPSLPTAPIMQIPEVARAESSGSGHAWGVYGSVEKELPGSMGWLIGPTYDLGPLTVGCGGGTRERTVQVGGVLLLKLAR